MLLFTLYLKHNEV